MAQGLGRRPGRDPAGGRLGGERADELGGGAARLEALDELTEYRTANGLADARESAQPQGAARGEQPGDPAVAGGEHVERVSIVAAADPGEGLLERRGCRLCGGGARSPHLEHGPVAGTAGLEDERPRWPGLGPA